MPLGTPPPVVVSNFVNPSTNAAPILGAAITGVVLAVCFVTIRVLTRIQPPRKFEWDDCEFR